MTANNTAGALSAAQANASGATPRWADGAAFAVLALRPGQGAGWRLVGRYGDFDSALVGQLEDVLIDLEAREGRLETSEHLVVGPDLDGSVGIWPQTTSLGLPHSGGRAPVADDRDACRRWLEQAHRRP